MEITLRGQSIGRDEQGFLNLNDIWKLSGEPATKMPRHWRRFPSTRELAQAVIVKFLYNGEVLYARRGNIGGTYAHIILALAYAEYLNPSLGVEVREIALRVYAGDVSVLDDYQRTKREQIQEDHDRVTVRSEIRRNNFDLNGQLKSIGARHKAQYAAFHDHGYQGLYNGMRENDIHARKKLKPEQKILDHMGFAELAYNMYRTALAQQHLKKYPVDTVKRACHVHKRMGTLVRSNLEETNLDMPEDLEPADSIKGAEKRLKEHKKSLK